MPRYTSNFSRQELKDALLKCLKALPAPSGEVAQLSPKLIKDVSKIRADFSIVSARNAELCEIVGFHEMDVPHFMHDHERDAVRKKYKNAKGKMQFLGCLAGSRNETPVFFLLYLNYDGTLRGYVPEKGNSFDKKSKMALPKNPKKTLKSVFDVEAMKQDIRKRIHYFADSGLSFIPDAKM